MEAVAEETDKNLRQSLSQKAKILQTQLIHAESALLILREECAQASNNVVDLSVAFEILKVFRENFDSQPAAGQADILREIVKRVVVYSDRVVAEFCGSRPIRIDLKNGKSVADSSRSRVRTVFNLVETKGATREFPSPNRRSAS